jgi:hypothetical protein
MTAQDSTPSTGAEECTVEAYDLTSVLSPREGTPVVVTTDEQRSTERPTGEPANEGTIAAVTETIELFVGCVNQGFTLRVLYLFSPDYLQRFVDEEIGPLTSDEIEDLNDLVASEVPSTPRADDEQTIIVSIDDVEVLEDGRVVATVVGDDLSQPKGPSPIYFIFEEVEGRFLIDDVIDPRSDQATPEPGQRTMQLVGTFLMPRLGISHGR